MISRVNGKAAVGNRVAYEDMANPRKVGRVTKIDASEWGNQYHVEFDDGTGTVSDLRQYGWTFADVQRGDIVEVEIGERTMYVQVHSVEDDIKNGQPGIEGRMVTATDRNTWLVQQGPGARVWAYGYQILRVLD